MECCTTKAFSPSKSLFFKPIKMQTCLATMRMLVENKWLNYYFQTRISYFKAHLTLKENRFRIWIVVIQPAISECPTVQELQFFCSSWVSKIFKRWVVAPIPILKHVTWLLLINAAASRWSSARRLVSWNLWPQSLCMYMFSVKREWLKNFV